MTTEATSRPLAWAQVPNPAVLIGVCAAVVVGGLLWSPAEGWAGLLTASIYAIMLVLGGALFAAIQISGGATWWHPVRAGCLTLNRMLPVPALLLIATLALGLEHLYPWAREGAAESSHLLHEKVAWLNVPFFFARAIVVLAVWHGMSRLLETRIRAQMATPSQENRVRLVKVSAIYILVFAATISVASWDWTMSLEPEWFSTMYGVYWFSGIFQGAIASLIVIVLLSNRANGYRNVSQKLLHDLGKLLFGFSMFWAYIWFCQFMLIWYANLPEETFYFSTRLGKGWGALFLLNPVLGFAVPFLVLLSERVKKNPQVMLQVALIVLAGRWLDVHLMIAPSTGNGPEFPGVALAATVGLLVAMATLQKRVAAETRK